MFIRNLDPRTAAPVALAPCNRRRRTLRVQRNAAVDGAPTAWMQKTRMQKNWIMSARMSSPLSVTRDGPTVGGKASTRDQAIAIGSPYHRLLIPC
jgi:hypothetical protein